MEWRGTKEKYFVGGMERSEYMNFGGGMEISERKKFGRNINFGGGNGYKRKEQIWRREEDERKQ